MNAFRLAAQRDVLATAGLEVELERFAFQGWHLGERKPSGLQLGFVAFSVDLERTDADDEVMRAVLSGAGTLLRVKAADLYSGTDRLNRILMARPRWLLRCLGLAAGS